MEKTWLRAETHENGTVQLFERNHNCNDTFCSYTSLALSLHGNTLNLRVEGSKLIVETLDHSIVAELDIIRA